MSALVSWTELEFEYVASGETLISWIELEVDPPAHQSLYPTSDIASTGWQTAPLWSKLNAEDTVTFITSTSTDTAEMALANPDSVGLGVISIQVTARKSDSSSNTLVVTLVEGTTIRASWIITLLGTTFTTYTLELTEPEVDSIVDWNNLRIRISHPESS